MNSVKLNDITLIHGDCLEVLPKIKADVVDMVFADLPYGTTACKWDTILPFDVLWPLLIRIGHITTPYVMTAQTPFDKVLGASNLQMLKYEWIWEKPNGTGHQRANKAPLKCHENVLVFYSKEPVYHPMMTEGKPYKNKRESRSDIDNSAVYGEQSMSRTDTINEGIRYPRSVQVFRNANYERFGKGKTLHPTQKPIELLEYLIKTYTNEGDVVLDPTMGSGTTAVACRNLNRRCIGIELNKEYFDIAVKRVNGELP